MADISASSAYPKREHLNRKLLTRQELSIRSAQAPTDHHDCLTVRAAENRWPGVLYDKVIYAAANVGLIHAVKIRGAGWTLYPEWELEWLAGELRAGKSLPQLTFEADREGRIAVVATGSSLKTPFASRSTRLIDKWAA